MIPTTNISTDELVPGHVLLLGPGNIQTIDDVGPVYGTSKTRALWWRRAADHEAVTSIVPLDRIWNAVDVSEIPGAEASFEAETGREIFKLVTCNTCGRTWNDAAISSLTPAPAGRCPFEAEHVPAETLTLPPDGFFISASLGVDPWPEGTSVVIDKDIIDVALWPTERMHRYFTPDQARQVAAALTDAADRIEGDR